MPALDAVDTGSAFVKALVIGDSGSGKTGALASLVKAGYHLGILDMDNKLASGILPKLLTADERSRVRVMAFRDKMKFDTTIGMPRVDGKATAFRDAMKAIDTWDDGTKPAEWGDKTIFVLDSLTFLGEAAFNWAEAKNPGHKDPRLWYGEAQDACETVIAQLTADNFKAHVVITSHVNWTIRQDGATKGYPTAIGKALGPKIPAYFNTMLLAETGQGKQGGERLIHVVPTSIVDVKTTLLDLPERGVLPQVTALATFFEQARAR